MLDAGHRRRGGAPEPVSNCPLRLFCTIMCLRLGVRTFAGFEDCRDMDIGGE